MNKIVVMGRLTTDPEVKTVGEKNTNVVNFSLAVPRDFAKDVTDFIPCSAFGGLAETMAKYLKKGSQIVGSGTLHIDKYTDKEGKARIAPRVVLDGFNFCGGKASAGDTTATVADEDDEIPFA